MRLRRRPDPAAAPEGAAAEPPADDPPVAAVPVEPDRRPADEAGDRRAKESWGFEAGDEIAPGRSVLDVLGGGSAYEVMLVWDERFFSLMVAKVLRPDRAEDPDEIRSLRKEVEALEHLHHPVLVRSFDAVLEGPHPHVVIEHLEGPTLRRLIRKGGPLGLEQVLPLALHVAAAVHYIAGEGWVHLDVKPDNIVMGVPPRLIDLSVARTQERAGRITGQVGTDAYMAPEQADPSRFAPGTIGPPADVFGLGATLFHAVAGSVPFPRPKGARDDEDLDVRYPQLHSPPVELPQRTPPELSAALARTLDPDPAARPSAAELVEALEPLVAALPRKLVLAKRGARAI